MNPQKVFVLYFNRYYRLTPLLAFVMYFSAFVLNPLASGPGSAALYTLNRENCRHYGWTNILYINNYYPRDLSKGCFGWTWYLANDIQMFLLLPWLVMLYKRSNPVGSVFLGLCYVASAAATFYIAYVN